MADRAPPIAPHIFFAYVFDGNGGARTLGVNNISAALRDDKLAWVDLNASMLETRTWLKNEITYLDDLTLDALLAEETRPRVSVLNNGLLLILRGMNLNKDANPEDMVTLRMWIDPQRIITLHKRNIKTIDYIEGLLKSGKGPKNTGDFLIATATRLFEYMQPVLQNLQTVADDIEQHVIERNPDASERQSILDVRRKAIIFRRYIAPQRDVIAQIREFARENSVDWLQPIHRRMLQEKTDRLTRYIEDLDSLRERAQVVKDELGNVLAERSNRNLYILSMVSVVFLPLAFLVELLGVNVGGIPGKDAEGGFWVLVVLLGALAGAEIYFFKKKKWF
jgi:zinc transporter